MAALEGAHMDKSAKAKGSGIPKTTLAEKCESTYANMGECPATLEYHKPLPSLDKESWESANKLPLPPEMIESWENADPIDTDAAPDELDTKEMEDELTEETTLEEKYSFEEEFAAPLEEGLVAFLEEDLAAPLEEEFVG